MFPQNNFPAFPMQSKFPMAPALYVGNLHESVDDQVLYEYFSKYGSIHFIRVMYDISTSKSRGYGFVNFVHARDAETAKQYAQYEVINGQSIRVMYRTTIAQDCNIVVKNLDKAINEKQLHEFFNQTGGTVTSVHIRKFKDVSLGFVNYSSIPEAEAALVSMNGQKLGEKNIVVEKFVSKKDRPAKKSIYLKNLLFSSEEEANKWILDTFEPFGALESYKAFPFKEGVFSAFLCFKNDEHAEKAFGVFSQSPAVFGNGEKAYISWHLSKNNRKEFLGKRNIYLKNLKPETTSQDIEHIFRALGKVENVALRDWESKDHKRKAKFGFILFDSEDTALSILRNLNQIPDLQNFAIENAKVEVFPYQSKKQRQQFIAQQQRAKQYADAARFQQYQYQMLANPMAPFNRYNPPQMGFPAQRRPFQGQPYAYQQNRSQMNNGGNPRVNHYVNRMGQNNNAHSHGNNYQHNRPQNNGGNFTNNRRGNNNNVQTTQQRPQNANNQTRNLPQTLPAPNKVQPTRPQYTPTNIRGKLNELMALEPEKRKMVLGEILYPLVVQKSSLKIAPKITGMLIDLEVDEIIELIESSQSLDERISEALELLNDEVAAQ